MDFTGAVLDTHLRTQKSEQRSWSFRKDKLSIMLVSLLSLKRDYVSNFLHKYGWVWDFHVCGNITKSCLLHLSRQSSPTRRSRAHQWQILLPLLSLWFPLVWSITKLSGCETLACQEKFCLHNFTGCLLHLSGPHFPEASSGWAHLSPEMFSVNKALGCWKIVQTIKMVWFCKHGPSNTTQLCV